MDARTSQGPAAAELPRNLFFGAEDWIALQPNITDRDLALVRNQRHNMVGHVTHKAERLLAAVRSLKDFDGTGNAGSSLDHIEAIRDDLAKLTTNLIHDVEDAEARYEAATSSAVIDEDANADAAVEDPPAVNVRKAKGGDLDVSEAPRPGQWFRVSDAVQVEVAGFKDAFDAAVVESSRAGR